MKATTLSLLLAGCAICMPEAGFAQRAKVADQTNSSGEIERLGSQLAALRTAAQAQQAAIELKVAELELQLAQARLEASKQRVAALAASVTTARQPAASLPVLYEPTTATPRPMPLDGNGMSAVFQTAAYTIDADDPALKGAGASTDAAGTASKTVEVTKNPDGTVSKTTTLSGDRDVIETEESKFTDNFGIGAAVFFLNKAEVETAVISGGKILVTKSVKHKVTPWLQANYFWDRLSGRIFSNTSVGIFAGLGAGTGNDFLDTFAVGLLWGLKRTALWDKTNKNSLNFGLGYYVSSVRRLADGFVEGQALPAGAESIQYKERSARGLMANISFGF